ncbi:hypothetical protein STSP2_01501 [Anaerohalosphaera lusitana]|uniref:Nucleotidyl transferase AbiEii/AbiGii toxin family protein n=1 Tax=Anaerohalosphaera lusitana TaxID=1936003 RepID=A0A1U9NK92_9BACT|nr:nucleotidyl transferase AbiEii/AbiGii toxin family protein [Anaerohalosphaera lusitana]AQT68342.1 hypothetical protein STSP2_01501 [Anaerohalosphaera lusitana]
MNGITQSVHQKLLNIRDKTGEQFNHLLIRYGLERLLYRIVASKNDGMFVLKGAMLFALWRNVPGRPTRDVDLLGFGELDHERLKKVFTDACMAEVVDDGLRFDPKSIVTDDIRDDQDYHGVRVRLIGYLGNARIALQIDVGFGDAIKPAPAIIDYPTILDFPAPRIRAYHPATVVAEKFNAMIVLGLMNSRLKDFYDVYIILHHMGIDETQLADAIQSTFQRRKTPIPTELPLVFTDDFINDGNKEIQWKAFLKRSLLTDCELSFSQIVGSIQQQLWPIVLQLQNKKE